MDAGGYAVGFDGLAHEALARLRTEAEYADDHFLHAAMGSRVLPGQASSATHCAKDITSTLGRSVYRTEPG